MYLDCAKYPKKARFVDKKYTLKLIILSIFYKKSVYLIAIAANILI